MLVSPLVNSEIHEFTQVLVLKRTHSTMLLLQLPIYNCITNECLCNMAHNRSPLNVLVEHFGSSYGLQYHDKIYLLTGLQYHDKMYLLKVVSFYVSL